MKNITTTVKIKAGFVLIDTRSLETMVFSSNERGEVPEWNGLDQSNYDTEEEARLGHKVMIKKWEAK